MATKRMSVKAPLSATGWKRQYIQPLRNLVETVNKINRHTHYLARYIFINELETDLTGDLESYITHGFFKEVWLSCIDYRQRTPINMNNDRYRPLIAQHFDHYAEISGFQRIPLREAPKVAGYEASAILTEYTNNIALRYGNQLRGIINNILDVQSRKWNGSYERMESHLKL
jgi:hypothetical protein